MTLDYVHDAPQPYALSLQCTINPTDVQLEARYDDHLLPERQMQRVLQQFQNFLRLLLRAPLQLKPNQIPRVSPKDRQELLQWNKSIPTYAEHPLHEFFRRRAPTMPHVSVALEAPDGKFTYKQLNDFSDRLGAKV
ncbi:Nonribisomal peptide synthetase [Fulvia fulva]|nr:Nonribisomal peptide synthetase [Fulvia fulva]WPV17938.1 Nonribisomal peptide synthetase [Fulvia fulva]WPV33071.1 Nonribisomal peptide synthetase [Fulvia fulva]